MKFSDNELLEGIEKQVRKLVTDPVTEWIIDATFDWTVPIVPRSVEKCLHALQPLSSDRHACYFHGRRSAGHVSSEFRPIERWIMSIDVRDRDREIHSSFQGELLAIEMAIKMPQPLLFRGPVESTSPFEKCDTRMSLFRLYQFILEDILQGIAGHATVFENPVDALLAIRQWPPIGYTDGCLLLLA